MRAILFGPPGAGKGTQAEALCEAKGAAHIATGDMLRAATTAGTELGKKAKDYMDRGAYVPDEVILGLVRERLQEPDAKTGFILDGFPRTVPQAESLQAQLQELNTPLDGAVLFDVPEDVLIKRLSGRRICKACGSVYHLENRPPRVASRCDLCGGELIQRPDDREEVVRERFAVYARQTTPVLSFYEKLGLLRRIDAAADVQTVATRLQEALS